MDTKQQSWIDRYEDQTRGTLQLTDSVYHRYRVGRYLVTPEQNASSAKMPSPTSPSISRYYPNLNLATSNQQSTSVTYSVAINSISGLSIPRLISETYLKDESSPLLFNLWFHFFDMETGSFFGKSSCGKEKIDLRKALEADEDDPARTVLTGRLLKIFLQDHDIFFHSSIASPHVLLVVEYVLHVQSSLLAISPSSSKEELSPMSIGWSTIQLWHGSHAIDVASFLGNPSKDSVHIGPTSVSVYTGSPRLLALVPTGLIKNEMPSFFGLVNAQPGASLSYEVSAERGLQFLSQYLSEHVCYDFDTSVPGTQWLPEVVPLKTCRALISGLQLQFDAPLAEVERELSLKLADLFPQRGSAQQSNLVQSIKISASSPTKTSFGTLPTSGSTLRITERRLHIGVHNGWSFLQKPVVAVLEVSDKQDNLLQFNGSLGIERWINVDGVALVFLLEYEVPVNLNNDIAGRWFQRPDAVQGKGPRPRDDERHLFLGWCVWIPDKTQFAAQTDLTISDLSFISDLAKPNPFGCNIVDLLAFDAYLVEGMSEQENSPAIDIGFRFNPDAVEELSRPSSPVKPSLVLKTPTKKKDHTRSISSITAPEPSTKQISPRASSEQLHKRSQSVFTNVDIDLGKLTSSPSKSVRSVANAQVSIKLDIPSKATSIGVLTRSQRSRLFQPGLFDPVLDCRGKVVDSVVVGKYPPSGALGNVQKHLHYPVNGRVFGITLMGITFKDDSVNHRGVYFTLQLAASPYLTTDSVALDRRMHLEVISNNGLASDFKLLDNEESIPVESSPVWPAILRCPENNHFYPDVKGASGVYLHYNVSKDSSASAMQHFVGRDTDIGIWDAESHVQIGSVSLPLELFMCNEPSLPMNLIFDLDILSANEEGSVGKPADYIGQLHLRLSNIPYVSNDAILQGSWSCKIGTAVKVGGGKLFRSPSEFVLKDYRETLRHQSVSKNKLTKEANRLREADPEADEYLNMHHGALHLMHSVDANGNMLDTDKARKKLAKIRKVKDIHKTSAAGGLVGSFSDYNLIRQERNRDISTLNQFRDRKKNRSISSALEALITTHHHICAQFGEAYLVEFQLTNPFATDQLFQINFDDRELRVVTDLNEWRYLRRIHGIHDGSIEKDMISFDSLTNRLQIWLQADETVSVPFVYQSFRKENTPDTREAERDIVVSFVSQSSKKAVALLSIKAEIQDWFPVERTFRYYNNENEVFRTSVTYIPSKSFNHNPLAVTDSTHPHRKFLRSSSSTVLCHVEEKEGSNTNLSTVQIKYRCGKSSTKPDTFYILFYNDVFNTSLAGIWRFFVHPMERIDVHCEMGHETVANLIIRTDSLSNAGRRVKCFSCSPSVIKFKPQDEFDLVGNALNQVKIRIKPNKVGRKNYIVNLVDTSNLTLIGNWLVNSQCLVPTITKEFSLQIPMDSGLNKRVSYTNSYRSKRKFFVFSSDVDKLTVDEKELVIAAGKSDYLHLHFHTLSEHTQQAEVYTDLYIFIQDEEGHQEECLCIHASYV